MDGTTAGLFKRPTKACGQTAGEAGTFKGMSIGASSVIELAMLLCWAWRGTHASACQHCKCRLPALTSQHMINTHVFSNNTLEPLIRPICTELLRPTLQTSITASSKATDTSCSCRASASHSCKMRTAA